MEPAQGRCSVSAVILAGGRGERLGRDKALVELDGQSLVQRVIAVLQLVSPDIVVVERRGQGLQLDGVRVVADLAPYEGVLAALAAGLSAAKQDWCLVVACDMPFLNVALLNYMISQAPGHDAVVPRLPVGIEPLHALYHRRCLVAIGQALRAGEKRVASFYRSLRICFLGIEQIDRFAATRRSFYNINTQEELEQAREWLAEAHSGLGQST